MWNLPRTGTEPMFPALAGRLFNCWTTREVLNFYILVFVVVQSLSCVPLFATPWTVAHPTTSSSVIPFSSCLQSFQASGSFSVTQLFASGGQSIGVSASASTLPMNIQDWFPLGLTGLISLQSKGLSSLLQHHSSKGSILWLSAFFMVQLSHPYRTWKFFWLFSFEKQAFIYSPLIH